MADLQCFNRSRGFY